ncbi:MAG: helix-turn-helix transcriptional regulator [Candidatus Aenigmarchaeota archaeon]|nr:helix-turn-helix transcriptional regulator [Candidatus Aenigmarchaeota archaeon]MBU5689282.1 helix-turn-helix transcriptional regulator [Candidatus Aenigmarchaeota archaeon]
MKKICPIIESIKIIGTKPRLTIIRHLAESEKSFNELRQVCDMSSKTLSINIKYLLKENIISLKKEKNKHIYILTKKGSELLPILKMIGNWGKKWKIC